jgi:multidrug efflux system outer membrane protein
MSARRFVSWRTGHAGLVMAMMLSGCAVGPDYTRPVIDLPSVYPETPQADISKAEEDAVPAQWWTLYNDVTLNELVSTTLKNNVDLRKAIAQIDEAEATLSETSASFFPEIDLGASQTKSRSSTLLAQPLPPGTPVITRSNRITLSTAFELDFWGKLRRASEAARAQALGSRYARDVMALTLAGATTQTYFALRSLDAQIAATQETLASREESLKVVKSRAGGGLASELEVNQAEGVRADAAVQLRDMERQRALVEHQLGNLTGKLDLRIVPGDLMGLPAPALPPVGLPSSLLERRPDVQQAEQALVSANAQIGVAKAALFPTFSLTGNYGGQSENLSNLFKSDARIWTYGPSVSLPIFDAGKYSARTRQAEARQRQSLANYQKAVETAFREVADALTNVQQTTASVADVQAKVDAARNALRLSRLRYEAGYAGYLDVLDAQRTANAAELALVQNRQLQLSYSVDLMKALGGGWSSTEMSLSARH